METLLSPFLFWFSIQMAWASTMKNGLEYVDSQFTNAYLINTSGTLLTASSLLFFLFAKLLHAELKHVVVCNCAG